MKTETLPGTSFAAGNCALAGAGPGRCRGAGRRHRCGRPARSQQRVKASGTLRVCIWPDYYGVTFRSPRTQQLTGIDIDLSAELGRDLGVKVQHVDSSFPQLIEDLKSDRCDVAMFAVAMLPQRMEHLRFTRPYLQSDIYGITTKQQPRRAPVGRHRPARRAGGRAGRHLHGTGDGGLAQAGQAGAHPATGHARTGARSRPRRCLHDRLPLQPAPAGQRRLGAC
jgi:hypothetical protein